MVLNFIKILNVHLPVRLKAMCIFSPLSSVYPYYLHFWGSEREFVLALICQKFL